MQQPGLKMFRNLIAYRHRHMSLEQILFRVFQSCRHDGEMTTPALYHEFMLYPSTGTTERIFLIFGPCPCATVVGFVFRRVS